MVDVLAKYCSEAQDDWDEYLDSIACAYNSIVHENTGFSLYSLQHRRKTRLPIDLETRTTQLDSKSSTTEFAKKLTLQHQLVASVTQIAKDNFLSKTCFLMMYIGIPSSRLRDMY